jgi:hypothetical protein
MFTESFCDFNDLEFLFDRSKETCELLGFAVAPVVATVPSSSVSFI